MVIPAICGLQHKLSISVAAEYANTGSVIVRFFESGRGEFELTRPALLPPVCRGEVEEGADN